MLHDAASPGSESSSPDIEKGGCLQSLANAEVSTYTWRDCSVEVTNRQSKQRKRILDSVSGEVHAGELVALMGPSGSGKTTLLNVLAQRMSSKGAVTSGQLLIDGQNVSSGALSAVASFVEQEDVLIGSLTTKETMDLSARLARSSTLSRKDRKELVLQLLASFGLTGCADTLIGTPLRKGISGGQKRRVSVASQLITAPKILFLDEPTSGLDSTASREVMTFISRVAKELKLLVVASIHQPSTDTFKLFDKLLLLSQGKTCYFGPVIEMSGYLANIGINMPAYTNPAEFVLDITNADFDTSDESSLGHVEPRAELLQSAWATRQHDASAMSDGSGHQAPEVHRDQVHTPSRVSSMSLLVPLLHRAFIKSYRDVFTYGVRYAMYIGLATMMGTVWVRLKTEQDYIQSFVNAIFFGSAFMSFMAVAYVPAFLEDRAVYIKDRSNGLYGPLLFMITNFIIGLPYLFGMSVIFSVITYFSTNFRPTATAFFTWVMWLFLDLLAAESLVVFVGSLAPNFVISLAIVAFANGLWMSVGGFLIPIPLLNVFWKYVFHYIDYQAYVFQGMMVNEFKSRSYACAEDCRCSYPTQGLQCRIPGTAVLATYGYPLGREGKWVGILIGITAVYRLLGYIVLWWRHT